MASGRYELVLRGFGRLWRGESASGLGAGQLLERFAVEGDSAAFEALVGRHGPMVLGTCRRMLADPHDVDDAFQATFLVLARKAGSIQDADRLGPWLHGVARRVAARSRALSSRRRSLRRHAGDEPAAESPDLLEGSEIRAAIDEELARLPEKYRAPLVLCYLEGLTHDEAADQLRWPVGTVRSRLAGGRDRLRARLTRRGLAPSAAMPALLAKGILSPALLSRTIRVATSAGSAPADTATLAKGALIAMTWNKLKAVAALGLMAGLTVGGAGVAAQYGGTGKAEAKPEGAQVENWPSKPDRGVLKIGKLRHDDGELDLMVLEVKSIEATIPGLARQLEDAKRDRDRMLDAIAALKKKLGNDPPPAALAPPAPLTRDQLDAEMQRLRVEQYKVDKKIKELGSEHDRALVPLQKAQQDLANQEFELTQRWKMQHRWKVVEIDLDARIKGLEKQIADQAAVIRDLRGRGEAPTISPGAKPASPAPNPVPAPSPEPDPGATGPGTDGPTSADRAGARPVMVEALPGEPKLFAIFDVGGDRVTVVDADGKVKEVYRAPAGVTVEKVFPGTITVVKLAGPKVGQLVVFDHRAGKWATQELKRPVDGSIVELTQPGRFSLGSTQVAEYWIEGSDYLYNPRVSKWSVLETSTGNWSPMHIDGEVATVKDGDLIHFYNAQSGEWTHFNTKDDK